MTTTQPPPAFIPAKPGVRRAPVKPWYAKPPVIAGGGVACVALVAMLALAGGGGGGGHAAAKREVLEYIAAHNGMYVGPTDDIRFEGVRSVIPDYRPELLSSKGVAPGTKVVVVRATLRWRWQGAKTYDFYLHPKSGEVFTWTMVGADS